MAPPKSRKSIGKQLITLVNLTKFAQRYFSVAKYASIQFVIQGIAALSGILILRTLSKQDYAFFIIANTMQASMTSLSEMGISSVLTSRGGLIYKDPLQFGELLNTAFHLRRFMLFVSAVAVVPVLSYLLYSNGAQVDLIAMLSVLILTELVVKIFNGYKSLVPRLHGRINLIQNVELTSALIRLALLVFFSVVLLNPITALVASLLSFLFESLMFNRELRGKVDSTAPVNEEIKREMIKVVLNQAPYYIYYVVQGQITILLISVFGNTNSISDVGALSRLGVLFLVVGSVVLNFVTPALAKSNETAVQRRIFRKAFLMFWMIGVAVIGFSLLAPGIFLAILGNKYATLGRELPVVVSSSVLSSFVGLLNTLNQTKGWIKKAWLTIPISIVLQVLLILTMDMSVTMNVLLFGVCSTLPFLFVHGWMSLSGLRLLEWAKPK